MTQQEAQDALAKAFSGKLKAALEDDDGDDSDEDEVEMESCWALYDSRIIRFSYQRRIMI